MTVTAIPDCLFTVHSQAAPWRLSNFIWPHLIKSAFGSFMTKNWTDKPHIITIEHIFWLHLIPSVQLNDFADKLIWQAAPSYSLRFSAAAAVVDDSDQQQRQKQRQQQQQHYQQMTTTIVTSNSNSNSSAAHQQTTAMTTTTTTSNRFCCCNGNRNSSSSGCGSSSSRRQQPATETETETSLPRQQRRHSFLVVPTTVDFYSVDSLA